MVVGVAYSLLLSTPLLSTLLLFSLRRRKIENGCVIIYKSECKSTDSCFKECKGLNTGPDKGPRVLSRRTGCQSCFNLVPRRYRGIWRNLRPCYFFRRPICLNAPFYYLPFYSPASPTRTYLCSYLFKYCTVTFKVIIG